MQSPGGHRACVHCAASRVFILLRVVSAQIIHFSDASSNDFQMDARDFHMRLGTASEYKTPSAPESQWHFGIDIGVGVNDLKMAGPR